MSINLQLKSEIQVRVYTNLTDVKLKVNGREFLAEAFDRGITI